MKSRPAPPCYTKDITWRWEKYVKWDLSSDPNSATLDKYSLLWFSVGFLFHLGTSDNFQYLHVKWSNKKIINSSSSISSIYTSSNFHPTAAQLYPRPSNSPAQGLLRAFCLLLLLEGSSPQISWPALHHSTLDLHFSHSEEMPTLSWWLLISLLWHLLSSTSCTWAQCAICQPHYL